MEVGSDKPRSVLLRGNLLSSSPIKKHGGSPRQKGALYDSFELLAMTRQLNKAMQGSSTAPTSSPPFKFIPNSTLLYKHRMNRICKEGGGGTNRRISTYQSMLDKRPTTKEAPARGFVARLWKKVRQGLSIKYLD